jgi:hypothetical protein
MEEDMPDCKYRSLALFLIGAAYFFLKKTQFRIIFGKYDPSLSLATF